MTNNQDLVGRNIVAFGQVTRVISVEAFPAMSTCIVHIEPAVCVPGPEYTRNYLKLSEITEVKPTAG